MIYPVLDEITLDPIEEHMKPYQHIIQYQNSTIRKIEQEKE